MSLANMVHSTLAADSEIASLGVVAGTIRRSAPTDVPEDPLFVILRWGPEDVPVGRDTNVRPHELSVWVYNREPNYAPISQILNRIRVVMLGLESVRHTVTPPGWVSAVLWQGRSPDLYDDAYKTVVRNDTYRIIAD